MLKNIYRNLQTISKPAQVLVGPKKGLKLRIHWIYQGDISPAGWMAVQMKHREPDYPTNDDGTDVQFANYKEDRTTVTKDCRGSYLNTTKSWHV